MTNDRDDAETIPGLERVPADQRDVSPMRRAVIATIEALEADRLLEPRHAAMCQLALELADAVTAGRRSGRASAAAMAAGQLRDTLLALPVPIAGDAAQRFAEFVDKLLTSEAGG